jgi:putative flippase GtrA
LHYFIAILSAQVVTIAGAFPVYRRLVFRSTGGVWADFMRFLLVWSSGAISGIVLTPLLVEVLRWHPLVAQVVAIAVIAAGSFLAHRFFTFARSDATPGGRGRTRRRGKP